MRLTLTDAQIAEIRPHLRPGFCLLARIDSEAFDGTNPTTSGTPNGIEFGPVPVARLQALRDAIKKANSPTPAKARRTAKTTSSEVP